jgi:Protein of unknown function (DUF998)
MNVDITMLKPSVQALSLHPGVRSPRSTDHRSALVSTARVSAVAGVVAYNWWLVVPFVPGLMPSVNGFFSDLEATGRPHATLMSDADMAAGLLMAAALVLRGSASGRGARKEWKWMMAFALAGAIGGRFPYACSEGLSATCRNLEWHLQLPVHHYVHVVAGIAEFVTLTTAAVIAMARTRFDGTRESRIYAGVVKALMIGYPFLGAVYLTDRLGTLVEPIFFIAFSVMVLTEVFEPSRSPAPSPSWAERVAVRGTGDAPQPVGPAARTGTDSSIGERYGSVRARSR